MTKSSTNVLFATSFSTQDLIYESIPSYQRWLDQIQTDPYKPKSSLVLNQQPFSVTSVLVTQLKAVKSCLMCFSSYCHTHLEQHETVTRLKKHQSGRAYGPPGRQDV